MRERLNSYTTYSVGCGLAWAAILAATRRRDDAGKIRLAFAGWLSGWTSATIARYLYPPPRSRRRSREPLWPGCGSSSRSGRDPFGGACDGQDREGSRARVRPRRIALDAR
jgi:hypothetical protein